MPVSYHVKLLEKLKQFKDLRDQAKALKDNLAQETVEGSAEWGKIKITMDGNQQVLDVVIDPELLSADNQEKLQSGIKEAINDGIKKIHHIMADKMKQSGMGLPGM